MTNAEQETIRKYLSHHWSLSGIQFHADGRVTGPGRAPGAEPVFLGYANELLAEAQRDAYDMQLDTARELLEPRIGAAAKADDWLLHQLRCSVSDALANEWQEGISTEDWAERAAKRVGI